MGVQIKPSLQIQRINELETRLENWESLTIAQWTSQPNSKSWSAIEVIQHMIQGHKAYQDKINDALKLRAEKKMTTEFTASAIPSFLLKRFPPKKGVVRFKMKTTKVFKPVLDNAKLNHDELYAIITNFKDSLNELKGWIEIYRTSAVSKKKFNSAIGAVVRFTIPEACEFILCHNERHFLQIEKALSN